MWPGERLRVRREGFTQAGEGLPAHVVWIGALTLSMAVTTVVFLFSGRLQKLLGEQAITALERLMGLVLTAISIEMLLSGVAAYIQQFNR